MNRETVSIVALLLVVGLAAGLSPAAEIPRAAGGRRVRYERLTFKGVLRSFRQLPRSIWTRCVICWNVSIGTRVRLLRLRAIPIRTSWRRQAPKMVAVTLAGIVTSIVMLWFFGPLAGAGTAVVIGAWETTYYTPKGAYDVLVEKVNGNIQAKNPDGTTLAGPLVSSGANDQSVSQTAVNTLGVVFFRSATYTPNASVHLASGAWIKGEGKTTIFRGTGASAFDSNGALTDVRIGDMQIDGTNQASGKGVYVNVSHGCTRFMAERLWVHDTPHTGIGPDGLTDFSISNCLVETCAKTVDGNGIGVGGTSTRGLIYGNTVRATVKVTQFGNGIQLEELSAPNPVSLVVVSDNISRDNGGYGIGFVGCKVIKISDNECVSNNAGIVGYFNNTTFTINQDINISDNIAKSNSANGIWSNDDRAFNWTVTSNEVANDGSNGIAIHGTRMLVASNTVNACALVGIIVIGATRPVPQGTASVTNGNASVTFSQAQSFGVGNILFFQGDATWYQVKTVTDSTHIVLHTTYQGTTGASVAMTVGGVGSYVDVKHNTVDANGQHGIQISGVNPSVSTVSFNCTVIGNTCRDNGQSASASFDGINLSDSQTTDVRFNTCYDTNTVTKIQRYGVATFGTVTNNSTITDNNLSGNQTNGVRPTYVGTVTVRRNLGYVTENTGTSTKSGDGSTTAFTIAHGCAKTPTVWFVTPTSGDASAGTYQVTADATNLTVTYNTAPRTGTSNLTYAWKAEV